MFWENTTWKKITILQHKNILLPVKNITIISLPTFTLFQYFFFVWRYSLPYNESNQIQKKIASEGILGELNWIEVNKY